MYNGEKIIKSFLKACMPGALIPIVILGALAIVVGESVIGYVSLMLILVLAICAAIGGLIELDEFERKYKRRRK